MSEPRGRPFAPGNTLGRGRPKGSRNRPGSEADDLLEQHTLNILKTCMNQAVKGNPTALRLCMERAMPVNRNASIRTNLPRVKTAQDLEKAGANVIRDMGRGKITPAEGEKMMNIFESQSRIIADSQIVSRLKKVEEDLAEISRLPKAA
jgi:hypothetical protein